MCCALHNVCERHQCPFESSWLPDENSYTIGATTSQQSSGVHSPISALIRDALAKHVHRTHPALSTTDDAAESDVPSTIIQNAFCE